VPGATPVWLNVAGVHAVVRWHTSHCAVVVRWPADFTSMFVNVPPWQLEHVPGAIPAWPNVAGTGSHVVVVLWHESHAAVVGMCPLAGLPVACVPLWQVAHVPGATLAWLNDAGVQAVVRWHTSHCAVVVMWPADFTSIFANVPPWQLEHVPGAMPAWPNVAGTGSQVVVVLWHESHATVVGMCPLAGLPVAWVPLWQVAHVPGATPAWLNVAGFQAVVRWHTSHWAVVVMCVGDFTSMFANVPPWQVEHVPAAIPAWPNVAGTGNHAAVDLWHESHAAVVAMCPLAGLPVADVPLWQVAQLPAATPL